MEVKETKLERVKKDRKQGRWDFRNVKRIDLAGLSLEPGQITFLARLGDGEYGLAGTIYSVTDGFNTNLILDSLGAVTQLNGSLVPQFTNAYDLGISTQRWRRIYLVNSPSVSSDIRFKKNIEEAAYGLSEIEQITPIKYERDEDDAPPQIGFSAQELQDIIPEMVEDVDEQLSITPDSLIPVLVNAVKELSARVKELESKVV